MDTKYSGHGTQRLFLTIILMLFLCASAGCGNGMLGSNTLDEILQPPDANSASKKCNLHEELCDRRFNEVTFAMTHNSMSNRAEEWGFANQMYGISRQLQDGIRGINLDIYNEEGDVYLCHGYCNVGKEKLSSGLAKIKFFLDTNTDEVVTLIFESYVSSEDVKAVFDAAGMMPYLYSHSSGEQWPTLREMINTGKRLMVFTDRDGGDFGWYHAVWDYAWETKFSYKTTEDFECGPNRGNPANDLYIMNHFLTNPLASPYLAEVANANPLLLNRVNECVAEKKRTPTFILVDFYDTGDIFEVVDTMNGVK